MTNLTNTVTITADGISTPFNVVNPRSGGDSTLITVTLSGTFGGGTATVVISGDGGSNYGPYENQAGNAIAFTTAGTASFPLSNYNPNNPLKVAISLAGATAPSITFRYDQAR